MTTSIEIAELDDEHERRRDFRRANGAPLVSDPDNPDKSLRYSRCSSYAKVLDDEEALTNWRIWKAMEGVARSKALATQVVATRDDDRESKKGLRERALDKGAANEKADQGTGLHAILARIEDVSDDFVVPDEYDADVSSYLRCLRTYGLESALIECHMVNDDYRAAGTADRIYRLTRPLLTPHGDYLEPGTLVVGDLKTGQKLDFSLPGYAVQMALYATGVLYDIHAERRLVTPDIDPNWTLLVHTPAGRSICRLLWCSIETGLYGAFIAHEVKQWRKRWKSGAPGYDELPVPEPTCPDPTSTVPEDREATPPGEIMAEMLAWCRERITAIGLNDHARRWLITSWPADLPKPSAITTPDNVVRLLDLLDAIEAEFSLQFPGNDPRLAYQIGKNKNEMDRSNSFMMNS
jgi:hypothetical protein